MKFYLSNDVKELIKNYKYKHHLFKEIDESTYHFYAYRNDKIHFISLDKNMYEKNIHRYCLNTTAYISDDIREVNLSGSIISDIDMKHLVINDFVSFFRIEIIFFENKSDMVKFKLKEKTCEVIE